MDKYAEANAILSKFSKNYMELKKDLPIRPSEMAVLNIIVQREGRYTPLMIAELLEVSKPMITAHISVLEKKKYITKEPSKDDKRSFYIFPTEKAIELVSVAGEKTENHLKYIKNELGIDDYKKLLSLLRKVNTLLIERKDMYKNGLK